jgi:hypothetical protein
VTKENGSIYTDGLYIDALYSPSRFYRGSIDVMVEPPSEQPLLVATTLTESASNSFQRSALLMSDHTDALCELVQFVDDGDDSSSLPSIRNNPPIGNRGRKKQRGRGTKRKQKTSD